MILEDRSYEPPKYTAQFPLWQLFALTTVAAVVLAALSPWIRSLALYQLGYAAATLFFTLLIYLWCNFSSATAYSRALAAIGQPFGQMPYRPFVPAWATIGSLTLLTVTSVGILCATISLGSLSTEQRIANLVQGSAIAGVCLAAIHKRLALKPLLIYGDCGRLSVFAKAKRATQSLSVTSC